MKEYKTVSQHKTHFPCLHLMLILNNTFSHIDIYTYLYLFLTGSKREEQNIFFNLLEQIFGSTKSLPYHQYQKSAPENDVYPAL